MSIILGVRAPDAQHVDERDLKELAKGTNRYAPDGTFILSGAHVGMVFQPYHTHERSRLEAQPIIDVHGNMLCFDGRLDNHEELLEALGLPCHNSPDSTIILAAFERWGENCFSRFIGDWALALWSSADRSLYLARDHAGMRTLYYEMTNDCILWSTYLETFFVNRSQRDLDETYTACYLACQSIRDLTPYKGITAVTPAHYIRIQGNKITRKPHWTCLARNQLVYQKDEEYEEHFVALFKQAVERRTGPGAPILAQLSGGMDSSSIVCMSDCIGAERGDGPEELLDTISYFDDSEPNWDERPYFEAVERKRRKAGIHLSLPLLSEQIAPAPVRYLWPGADMATYENERKLIERVSNKGFRVILSGFGGDELLGGLPSALPELADLLAVGNIAGFTRAALDWCLVDRTPLLWMVGNTAKFLVEQFLPPRVSNESLPTWGNARLRSRLKQEVHSSSEDCFLSLSKPSSIATSRTWWALLETLPHRFPRYFLRHEFRYPYLDRDLVDFLLKVPRRQLVRPGRRRAMMRSALRHVVPAEIVERRRKATRSRSVLLTLEGREREIRRLFSSPPAAMTDLVDQRVLERDALETIRKSNLRGMQLVLRSLFFALWCKQPELWSAVTACHSIE